MQNRKRFGLVAQISFFHHNYINNGSYFHEDGNLSKYQSPFDLSDLDVLKLGREV